MSPITINTFYYYLTSKQIEESEPPLNKGRSEYYRDLNMFIASVHTLLMHCHD